MPSMITIKIKCTNCNKEIEITEWKYNYRLKRNNNRGVFCSPKCGRSGQSIPSETKEKISLGIKKACDEGRRRGLSPTVSANCATCNKTIIMKRYTYNNKMKRNKRDKLFCSVQCSSTGISPSKETREKIRQTQIGVAAPQRGRKGRKHTEEMRKKMGEARKGIKSICDWDIVTSYMADMNITNYSLTRKPIPDALYVENGMLVAVEVEKKKYEHAARAKMLNYEKSNSYDKVIIVWYSRGIKRKEWIKTKSHPTWKETVFP